MTHVTIEENLLPLTGEVNDLLDAYVGSVQAYDFSKANSSYEARVAAVTKVASICYGNPKALGSISLFDRLQAESAGLPSSSYEFVPVLIDVTDPDRYVEITGKAANRTNCVKYGEMVCDKYLLTNLRALIADVGPEESLNYLNTDPAEQQIIRDNFKVFLFNVDLSTRAQMVRHRVSWQELSRRYVSGKKQPFQFYISKKMDDTSWRSTTMYYGSLGESTFQASTRNLIEACINHYNAAIDNGVKPEEARRILPQAMMTTIWGAFLPKQLENFFTLRLDVHAQKEIRLVAEAMKELV